MAVRKISSRACLESNATRHCSTDAQERTVSKLETLANKLGVPLRFGTTVGKYPQTIILDYKYQDSAVSVSSNGSFEINGEEFGSYDSYFSFSRVNIDDVKDALLSLKEEAGEEESLNESKDVYLDSQTRYELEQVLEYLEDSAGAFKKILSSNRWNETATDSLVDDMKDCFNRVKKIAYSLDSDRYSMFDGG